MKRDERGAVRPLLEVEEWIALPDEASDPDRVAPPAPRRRTLRDWLAALALLWPG